MIYEFIEHLDQVTGDVKYKTPSERKLEHRSIHA